MFNLFQFQLRTDQEMLTEAGHPHPLANRSEQDQCLEAVYNSVPPNKATAAILYIETLNTIKFPIKCKNN